MWRSKKFMFGAIAAAVILVASLGGVALAQTENTSGSGKTLLGRVATILGIEQQKVEDAFAQAQKDMQAEALDNYLKGLVDQGKITQEHANQYKSWWQSKPDTGPLRQQLREWQEARPDVPIDGGFGGRGFPGGMRGGRCF